MAAASETVRSAAAGVSAHLIYQVSARLLSFLVKAVVVRALKPAQFAFVEIRLYLIVALALLPAIHGFRPVALRIVSDNHAAALCYACIIVTIFLSLTLGLIMIFIDRTNSLALLIVTASLVVRSFAETPLIFTRRRQRYVEGSRARAISTLFSGISQTLTVSLITDSSMAAPASSISHLAYSSCLAVSMFFAAGPQRVPVLSTARVFQYLRRQDLVMAAVATGEGLIKFFLENGEGIILDFVCSAPLKGAYRLASNIGSVLARFFSEALEEQSFNVFSRLSPAFRKTGSEQDNETKSTCVDTLFMALKAALIASALFALIGPAYSYALLRILYGSKWADDTEAPRFLDFYFVYLVFMAANGVSEAFVSASASTKELKDRSKFSMTLSLVYMASLYYAANTFHILGIVFVNCLNMAFRTCYSVWFFRRFTGQSLLTLTKAIPHFGVILTLFVARQISRSSEAYFIGSFGARIPLQGQFEVLGSVACHAMSGVVALMLFALSMLIFERRFISQIKSLRPHQD